MGTQRCYNCGQPVVKDVAALNKKMLGHFTKRLLCINCLAGYLDCTEDELNDLIEELKEQGCTLFI
ncbi:MAG: hypothetical protein WBL03_04400 [bacterium]